MKPEYIGLYRTDAHQWNMNRIIIGCFTLAPIKIMALLVYLIIFFIFALLLLLIGKFNKPFEKALVGYTRLYNYIMKLFVIDIKEEFEDLTITTPIIISNHVNWFDIFYMVLRLLPISFISKGDVANYPLIGTLARAINCIFLDRKDTENRKSAV